MNDNKRLKCPKCKKERLVEIVGSKYLCKKCKTTLGYDPKPIPSKPSVGVSIPAKLKSTPNLSIGIFFDRDNQRQEIDDVLCKNNVVFITGIGGIGKSELARKYATEKQNIKYDTVQFIPFDTNLKKTIAEKLDFNNFDAERYSANKDSAQRIYEEKIKFLSTYDERTLIIIDNFNVPHDDDFENLTKLKCHFIFTSRYNFSKEYGAGRTISVERIDDESKLLELFYSHCEEYENCEKETEIIIRDIINEIAGHTFTVVLIAKTIANSGKEPHEILYNLKESFTTNFDVAVEMYKNGKPIEQNAFAHIKSIFDISKFEHNDVKRQILMCMSLVPVDGIKRKLFKEWLKVTDFRAINDLINSGWIIARKDITNDFIISLHPIVSEIIYQQLTPNSDNCKDYIRAITEHSNSQRDTAFDEKKKAKELIQFACKRIIDKTALSAELYTSCGNVHEYISQYKQAWGYHEKALEIRKNFAEKNPLGIAESYVNIGNMLLLFDPKNALVPFKKALEIQQIHAPNGEEIVDTYHKIGRGYIYENDFINALNYCKIAIEKCENLEKDSPVIPRAYNNLGFIYQDDDMVFENYKKALDLRLKYHLHKKHDLAVSYHNTGYAYGKLRQYDNALIHLHEAKKIEEVIDGENHSSTAYTYNNIGRMHGNKAEYDEALKYFEKAREIREDIFGNYFLTAQSYNNISAIYRKMGGHERKIAEYNKKVLEICPTLCDKICDSSISKSYDDLGEYIIFEGVPFYIIE